MTTLVAIQLKHFCRSLTLPMLALYNPMYHATVQDAIQHTEFFIGSLCKSVESNLSLASTQGKDKNDHLKQVDLELAIDPLPPPGGVLYTIIF